jgi:serine/threonine protein kinase
MEIRWRKGLRGDADWPGPLSYAHFEVEVGDAFPVELGAGALAVTYRARDTVLRSVVALKVIGRQMAENPAARTRFLREARAAAQLHHPNVARVTYEASKTVDASTPWNSSKHLGKWFRNQPDLIVHILEGVKLAGFRLRSEPNNQAVR